MTSHLYEIIPNPEYKIGKVFAFPDAYEFLSTKTVMLEAAAEEQNQDLEESKERPIGTKAARKSKKMGRSEFKESTVAMANSVDKIEKALTEAKQAKAIDEIRSIALQEKKLEWEMLKELMRDQKSCPEERAEVRSVLRKRLLSSVTGSPVSKRSSAISGSAGSPKSKRPKSKNVDLFVDDSDSESDVIHPNRGFRLEDMKTQPPPGYLSSCKH